LKSTKTNVKCVISTSVFSVVYVINMPIKGRPRHYYMKISNVVFFHRESNVMIQ